ncbi:MAG: hypothetical protein RLZZ158_2021 [Cyanobacteriota bacterium]
MAAAPQSPAPATQVELLHADGQRVIVRVSRSLKGVTTAALGEAAGAEEAEDRARQRLQQRLNAAPPPASNPVPAPAVARAAAAAVAEAPQQSAAPAETLLPPLPDLSPGPPAELPLEPSPEPDDWSEELTAVDMEMQRLGWDRDQEGLFLERAFGHPSRSRLVTYADLVAHLKALRLLEPAADPATAALPLRRPDLLGHSDSLLEQLHWGPAEGRAFLEEHFSLASRQQLSDDQLWRFNQLLQERLAN